jgi:hypothetical protein
MKKLIFKTIDHNGKAYCGVRESGMHLAHRFIDQRNGHGHDPGYVYLVYLPNGGHSGRYHIGKAEYPRVGCDGFDLDRIELKLLEYLEKRMTQYHPGKGTDQPYDGAKFVHAIRVACGEGAEKQPHHFFKANKLPGREMFHLTEKEVAIFKNAEGRILGREIKHLTAHTFASYLAHRGMPDDLIREWVLLPDSRKIDRNLLKSYLIEECVEQLLSLKSMEPASSTAPSRINRRSVSMSGIPNEKWYSVNGFHGTELPTLFERCIKSLNNEVALDVALKDGINIEEKIFRFKNHWRYQDYTKRYNVSPKEWSMIFETLRTTKDRKS